jgi:hypothetical protein
VTVAFTCLNVVSDFRSAHEKLSGERTVYHCSTAEEHRTRLRIPELSKIYTVLKNLISRTCGLWILERTSFFFHSKKKTEKKTQWSHMRGGAIIWNSFVSSVGSRFILIPFCLDTISNTTPRVTNNNELYFSISLYVVCATLYTMFGFLLLSLTQTTSTDEVLEPIHVLRLQSFWL